MNLLANARRLVPAEAAGAQLPVDLVTEPGAGLRLAFPALAVVSGREPLQQNVREARPPHDRLMIGMLVLVNVTSHFSTLIYGIKGPILYILNVII